MAQTILTSTITLRRQSPSRSFFLLFPWTQSLRCLHTTIVRPRSAAAYQSISTRQPAQASPMLLAKQQYLKTRIKDLGILPGMYNYPARKRPQASFPTCTWNIYLLPRERRERERESKKTRRSRIEDNAAKRLFCIYTTGTFIMPTGDKKPSLLREPRRRWRLEFHRLKCRITDLRG